MNSSLDRWESDIRRVSPGLVAWHQELSRTVGGILTKIGGLPTTLIDDPASAAQNVAAPSPADFNVLGIDGKFVILVNNPQTVQAQSMALARARFQSGINLQNSGLFHHLQSSTDLNFNQNSNLKDYGTSQQLLWTDQDPNVTRFFRLQSSYDGKTWNAWQVFSSALTCGPVGVWSGLLRTAALTQVNAAYTPTTQPLSAATGSGVNEASIDVASFQVLYPSSIGLVSYNSGVITPLLDSTYYYVYCLDPEYAGGAQTYLATTDNPTITSNEALVFMGAITTPAHGGGGTTGGGGGGGPCFSENTLIITKDGIKHFRDVIGMHDHILTQKGWRLVRNVICHLGYTGAMCDMDNDELVTPAHRFWWKHGWVRAEHLFIGLPKIERFTGPVYNLEIDGDGSDDEQCYTLANGWIAHNTRKII